MSEIDESNTFNTTDPFRFKTITILGTEITDAHSGDVFHANSGNIFIKAISANEQEYTLEIAENTDFENLSLEDIITEPNDDFNEEQAVNIEDTGIDEEEPSANDENEVDEPRLIKSQGSDKPTSGPPRILKRARSVRIKDGPDLEEPKPKVKKGGDNQREPNVVHFVQHPKGLKNRGNRKRTTGSSVCSTCGQTFVNNARLERHTRVHQIFGSFLCPLCGKTYKYEYNLFFHWRKTCKELDHIKTTKQRMDMDTNELRQVVDEVNDQLQNRQTVNIDPGTSLIIQQDPSSQRGDEESTKVTRECDLCGLSVMMQHYDKHYSTHSHDKLLDKLSVSATYFCELCGLMFRQKENLYKHWRSACKEIQKNIQVVAEPNHNGELSMSDEELFATVCTLLKYKTEQYQRERTAFQETIVEATSSEHKVEQTANTEQPDLPPMLSRNDANEISDMSHTNENLPPPQPDLNVQVEDLVDVTSLPQIKEPIESGAQNLMDDGDIDPSTGMRRFNNEWNEPVIGGRRFSKEQCIVNQYTVVAPLDTPRAKWSMLGGPVQCEHCGRSFANIGRLERHVAGFHTGNGAHHCILCGNRFKYDYNLLYHYRHSCPYTKAFIDTTAREQLDSNGIRKLVRVLHLKHLNVPPAEMDQMLANSAEFQIHMSDIDVSSEPHLCPLCDAAPFSSETSLYRHFKRVHPDQSYELTMENNASDDAVNPEPITQTIVLPNTNSASTARVGDTLVIDSAEYIVSQVEPSLDQPGYTTLHLVSKNSTQQHFVIIDEGTNQPVSALTGPPEVPASATTSSSQENIGTDSNYADIKMKMEKVEQSDLTQNLYSCEQCGDRFKNNLLRERHIKRLHPSATTSAEDSHASDADRMLVTEDIPIVERLDGKYGCALGCNNGFRTIQALRNHWVTFKCSKMKERLPADARKWNDQDIIGAVLRLVIPSSKED